LSLSAPFLFSSIPHPVSSIQHPDFQNLMTTLIDIIAGARPNFMKIAPIIESLERRKTEGVPLNYRLIHTGQHYDKNMSGSFFEQLGIPEPQVNFGVGGGSQAEQTGA